MFDNILSNASYKIGLFDYYQIFHPVNTSKIYNNIIYNNILNCFIGKCIVAIFDPLMEIVVIIQLLVFLKGKWDVKEKIRSLRNKWNIYVTKIMQNNTRLIFISVRLIFLLTFWQNKHLLGTCDGLFFTLNKRINQLVVNKNRLINK